MDNDIKIEAAEVIVIKRLAEAIDVIANSECVQI